MTRAETSNRLRGHRYSVPRLYQPKRMIRTFIGPDIIQIKQYEDGGGPFRICEQIYHLEYFHPGTPIHQGHPMGFHHKKLNEDLASRYDLAGMSVKYPSRITAGMLTTVDILENQKQRLRLTLER